MSRMLDLPYEPSDLHAVALKLPSHGKDGTAASEDLGPALCCSCVN